jgi:hypothetical protein
VKFIGETANLCPAGAPCKETYHDPLDLKKRGHAQKFRQFYRLDNCGTMMDTFDWQGKLTTSPFRPNGVSVAACEDAKFMAATPDVGVVDGSLFAAYPYQLRVQTRFVTILREPVSRLLSWYNHAKVLYPSELAGATSFQNYHRKQLALWRRTKDPESPIGRGFYTRILDNFRGGNGLGLVRAHLLVMNFDHLVKDPADAFRQITTHLGLPVLTHHTDLPETNGQMTDAKVISIKCHTRNVVHATYKHELKNLYAQLKIDKNGGRAPYPEQRFREFNVEESVHCTRNREITVGQAKETPSLIPDLEERLRIHRIAEFDEDFVESEEDIRRRNEGTAEKDREEVMPREEDNLPVRTRRRHRESTRHSGFEQARNLEIGGHPDRTAHP